MKISSSFKSLPLLINSQNKYKMGLLLWVLAILLYMPANHFHIFTPQFLPMTWIDENVPFLPYTVWIYVSEYLFFVVVYLVCRDLANLSKYFYSFLTLQSLSVLIFWLWPTTYPRELYPLPSDLEAITHYLFSNLRVTDTPANCCPSLHVSSVYLSSFIFLDDQKEKFPFFFLWGTAIALSTLTTKQHYIVDVIVGLVLAILIYGIFHKYVRYHPKR